MSKKAGRTLHNDSMVEWDENGEIVIDGWCRDDLHELSVAESHEVMRGMYMMHVAPKHLAELFYFGSNHGLNTVYKLIRDSGWKEEREKYWRQRTHEFIKGKVDGLDKVAGNSIKGLVSFTESMVRKGRDEGMGMKEAKLLSDILANIDRIARLEAGKPTDHSLSEHHYSNTEEIAKDLQRMLRQCRKLDPLAGDPEIH